MTILVNLNFDKGSLTGAPDFDSAVTDGGDLSVTVAAGLAGSPYGLSCLIDDTTAIYGDKAVAWPASNVLYVRRYINPNSITITENEIRVCTLINSAPPWVLASLWFGHYGTKYYLRAHTYKDDGSDVYTAVYEITNAEHYAEIVITRATGSATNNGTVALYIDGVLKETLSGIDNYDLCATLATLRLGPSSAIGAADSGTFYLDECVVADAGPIGIYFHPAVLTHRKQHTHLRM